MTLKQKEAIAILHELLKKGNITWDEYFTLLEVIIEQPILKIPMNDNDSRAKNWLNYKPLNSK